MNYIYLFLGLLSLSMISSCDLADDSPSPTICLDEEYIKLLDADAEDGSSYTIVKGLAADGVSKLEIAIPYDDNNLITSISLVATDLEGWGSISLDYPRSTKCGLDAYRFTLTADEALPAGLSDCAITTLNYYVEVVRQDGDSERYDVGVNVVRPAVVFVHGLGSSAETFDPMLGFIRPKGLFLDCSLYAVDYSQTATASYATNCNVVADAIDHVRSEVAKLGIVNREVAIIGHSMGGLLTRLYLQSDEFRNDILKLICIDTPHSGSQLADFALTLSQNEDSALSIFATLGAIVDLAVMSDATQSMNSIGNLAKERGREVPTHNITAHMGTLSDVANLVAQEKFYAALITKALDSIEGKLLYGDDSSDIVVPTMSQKGGLTTSLLTNYITTYENEWHCSVHTKEVAAERIIELLDAEGSNSKFFTTAGLNPPTLSYPVVD